MKNEGIIQKCQKILIQIKFKNEQNCDPVLYKNVNAREKEKFGSACSKSLNIFSEKKKIYKHEN